MDNSTRSLAISATVEAMTTLRVDAEAIRVLGEDLTALATVLGSLGSHGALPHGDLGHQQVAAGLDELLGNWTLMRHELADAIADLGQAAGEAGTAYLVVERGLTEVLGGAP